MVHTKKNEMNKKINDLQGRIKCLQDEFFLNPNDITVTEQLDIRKAEMENLIAIKTHGAFIRSRVKEYECGERNSKYFFNLEKRNGNIKSINRLELSNGEITEDQNDILTEMKNYYANLYTSANIEDPTEFLNNLEIQNKVKEEDKLKLDKDITEQEVLSIIKKTSQE